MSEAGGEYFPCPTPGGTPDCPYAPRTQGCHEIDGHRYFPAADYISPVERVFRNLPENIDRNCRRFEEELHAREKPPIKPSREVMLARIAGSGVQLSATKRRKVFGNA